MFNTNLLREYIKTQLLTALEKVYYLNFPKPAAYPYLVFELVQVQEHEDGRSDYQLTVDIVDRNLEDVLNISNEIKKMFDHQEFKTEKLMFHSYLDRESNVINDDKSIKQVNLLFDLFVF